MDIEKLQTQSLRLTEFKETDFKRLEQIALRINAHAGGGYQPFYAFQVDMSAPDYSYQVSEKVRAFLARTVKERGAEIRSTYRLAMRLRDKLIGNVTVDMLPQTEGGKTIYGDLGYFIDPKYGQKGYAGTAVRLVLDEYFKVHNVLDVTVHPDNRASIALIKSIGGTKVGEQEISHYQSEPRAVFVVHREQYQNMQLNRTRLECSQTHT